MRKNQLGFLHISLLIGVAVIAIVGLVGWRVLSKKHDSNTSNNTVQSRPSEAKKIQTTTTCPKGEPGLFTKDIIELSAVSLIQTPIRIIGGSNIKTHSYVEVKQRSPVYAPMDSTLNGGANYYETMGPNPVTKVQYLLSFNNECDVHYWFDHIVDVPETIKQAFPAEARDDTKAVTVSSVKIKAGELVGYSNQVGKAKFDFGVVNLKGPETILTTDARFKDNEIVKTSDKYRHAVCPYEFFDASKTQQYVDLFDNSPSPDQQIIDNICKAL